ncbi:MAG: manganese efflux pump [Bacteroidales bacterium]|nr:manganese efflux pump [Bacteroidales bacterium]
MTTFSYILLALALALESMLLTYRNTQGTALRLTKGLAVSLIMALMQTLLFQGGVWLGNLLRFDLPDIDKTFFIALFVVVVVKLLLPLLGRKREQVVYDLGRATTALALSVAASVNALLLGLGVGFVADMKAAYLPATIAIALSVLLLSYLGIMLGRRKKELAAKRWHMIAALMLLVAVFM